MCTQLHSEAQTGSEKTTSNRITKAAYTLIQIHAYRAMPSNSQHQSFVCCQKCEQSCGFPFRWIIASERLIPTNTLGLLNSWQMYPLLPVSSHSSPTIIRALNRNSVNDNEKLAWIASQTKVTLNGKWASSSRNSRISIIVNSNYLIRENF